MLSVKLVSGHPSIYKINSEHKQRIKKSGKQISKSNCTDQKKYFFITHFPFYRSGKQTKSNG